MSDYNTLLAQVEAAINLANSLSQNPGDNFGNCAASLVAAKEALVAGQDQSSICQCLCHQNPEWHTLPCGCYTGNPVL
jgi:hypothetical protein